jgi:hypothetical protein
MTETIVASSPRAAGPAPAHSECRASKEPRHVD